MIAVNRRPRAKERFVHLNAPANLDGADGVGSDALIHVAQPREAGWRAARAALRDAIGLQGASGLENHFVHFPHSVNGVIGRLVMVLGVEARRHGVNVVELVAVEIPVTYEPRGQLFVVLAHFPERGTKGCQVAGHARRLPLFVDNEPVGMLFHHIGNNIFVILVLISSILDGQRKPPKLDLDSLVVKLFYHVGDGCAAESVRPRLPVAVVVEPAVVECRPMNPQLFQFRNRVDHLPGRHIRFIAPAAPAHGVIFVVVRRFGQAFAFHGVGPQAQRLIEVP